MKKVMHEIQSNHISSNFLLNILFISLCLVLSIVLDALQYFLNFHFKVLKIIIVLLLEISNRVIVNMRSQRIADWPTYKD